MPGWVEVVVPCSVTFAAGPFSGSEVCAAGVPAWIVRPIFQRRSSLHRFALELGASRSCAGLVLGCPEARAGTIPAGMSRNFLAGQRVAWHQGFGVGCGGFGDMSPPGDEEGWGSGCFWEGRCSLHPTLETCLGREK